MRIGFGYDSHRFEEDGAEGAGEVQKIGGVPIPECPKLRGHSDADVLIHAIIDALLGAAALGNIGLIFPDTDPSLKGADSAMMLRGVYSLLCGSGYVLGNLDATVICERPKIGPHVNAITKMLAECLASPESAISVKGKTNEKMDDVGAGKGIEVHAVVLLKPKRRW